jgi:hypothetical protein
MERARAFAPPAGRSRGECGSGIALTRSPARPKIGAVHRGGGETSGSSSLGKQDRRAGDEIVPMHPRWERILRGESAYAQFQRMYRTAFALVPSPWRCKFYTRRSRDRSPERSSGGRARTRQLALEVRRCRCLAEVRRPRLTEFCRNALPLDPGSSATGRGSELTGERRASEG